MTAGFLVTFTPCGHVSHALTAPEPGSWLTHWGQFTGPGPRCQVPQQVAAVTPCPGCPQCRGHAAPAAAWQQPSLFGEAA